MITMVATIFITMILLLLKTRATMFMTVQTPPVKPRFHVHHVTTLKRWFKRTSSLTVSCCIYPILG